MDAQIVKREELEKYRTLGDAARFIESVMKRIERDNDKERNPYRLGQGNYKYLREEYIPIYQYLERVYGQQSSIMFKHVGIDNQPYDGVVKIDELYKRIEIAYLYLGKYSNDLHRELKENGETYHVLDAGELYAQIEKVVLDTARKKAKKPYGDTLIVLYYACGVDLYPGDAGMTEEMFELLIAKLQRIRYHAKRVDFFIPEIKQSESGKQDKPGRLYRIK